MFCPKCGYQHDGKFCPKCGTALDGTSKLCSKCGTRYDGNFCPNGCNSVQAKTIPGNKKSKIPIIVLWSIAGVLIVAAAVTCIIAFGEAKSDLEKEQAALNSNIATIESYLESDNFEAAEELINQCIEEYPSDHRLYLLALQDCVEQGRWDKLIELLDISSYYTENNPEVQARVDEINDLYADQIAEVKAAQEEAERLKAEQEAQEEAERVASEEAAAAAKAEEEREAYVASCQTIAYEDLARNPDKYKGQAFKFTGEVVDVVEPTFGNTVQLRINVTKKGSGDFVYYDDTIYTTITLADGDDRILVGDIISIAGDCKGLHSYISVLGAKISIPEIDTKYYGISY